MITSIDRETLDKARITAESVVMAVNTGIRYLAADEVDSIRVLLLAAARPQHTNEGLPCEFCGENLRRLQLDRDAENGRINARINWSWTKAEVAKQLKGLASLIRSMAEGL